MLEYGYPEEVTFLVRTDIKPQSGDLVVVEQEQTIYNGKPLGDGADGMRMGILGTGPTGEPRLESLTAGHYTFRLRRVVGKVVGPVASPLRVVEEIETADVDDFGLEWPDVIPG